MSHTLGATLSAISSVLVFIAIFKHADRKRFQTLSFFYIAFVLLALGNVLVVSSIYIADKILRLYVLILSDYIVLIAFILFFIFSEVLVRPMKYKWIVFFIALVASSRLFFYFYARMSLLEYDVLLITGELSPIVEKYYLSDVFFLGLLSHFALFFAILRNFKMCRLQNSKKITAIWHLVLSLTEFPLLMKGFSDVLSYIKLYDLSLSFVLLHYTGIISLSFFVLLMSREHLFDIIFCRTGIYGVALLTKSGLKICSKAFDVEKGKVLEKATPLVAAFSALSFIIEDKVFYDIIRVEKLLDSNLLIYYGRRVIGCFLIGNLTQVSKTFIKALVKDFENRVRIDEGLVKDTDEENAKHIIAYWFGEIDHIKIAREWQ